MTAVPVCLPTERIRRQLAADPTLPRLTPEQMRIAAANWWAAGPPTRYLTPHDKLRAAIVAASLAPLTDQQYEKLSLLLHPGAERGCTCAAHRRNRGEITKAQYEREITHR
jgi:hypothetical protein